MEHAKQTLKQSCDSQVYNTFPVLRFSYMFLLPLSHTLPLDHRIFVCPLQLLPFSLDYNFPISFRLSNFMFSIFLFICSGLLDSYVFDFDFHIFDFEFEILDLEFEIINFE